MSDRRVRRILPALLAAALLAGVSQAATPGAGPTVELKDFKFGPSTLTVSAGERVTWKNLDSEPHTVASVDGKFRSNALDTGDTFSFTFTTPGTYRYVCSIHPQMVGTIVVTAAKQ